MHPAACKNEAPHPWSSHPNPPQMITSTSSLSAIMPLTSLMRSKQTTVCLPPFPSFPSPPHTATGVNVSFIDVNTTNWASISGVAKVHNDKDLIERLWSPMCVTTSFSLPFPSLHTHHSGHSQHFGLLLRPWRWRS